MGGLTDEQIADVLTFVRGAYGQGAAAVSADDVKSVRAATAKRVTPWTADELLKAHPFPPPKTVLKNLVGTMYKGEWKTLPDFSTLKPALMEDFNAGVIDPAQSGLKDAFATGVRSMLAAWRAEQGLAGGPLEACRASGYAARAAGARLPRKQSGGGSYA